MRKGGDFQCEEGGDKLRRTSEAVESSRRYNESEEKERKQESVDSNSWSLGKESARISTFVADDHSRKEYMQGMT